MKAVMAQKSEKFLLKEKELQRPRLLLGKAWTTQGTLVSFNNFTVPLMKVSVSLSAINSMLVVSITPDFSQAFVQFSIFSSRIISILPMADDRSIANIVQQNRNFIFACSDRLWNDRFATMPLLSLLDNNFDSTFNKKGEMRRIGSNSASDWKR